MEPESTQQGSPVSAVPAPGRRLPAVLALSGALLWVIAGFGASRLRGAAMERGVIYDRTGGEAIASALGGFRGLAADFLWLRAFQQQEQGRYDETALTCRLILDLQPRFASVWSFLAWNQAYNLAFETNTPEDRWRWIQSGIRLLADDGVRRNPHTYVLFWELGQMYFFRLSYKGHDPFYRYYHEYLAPVPTWCASEYEFVDRGLYVEPRVRYRLYRKRVEPGSHRLGPPRGEGGMATRARTMYVVAVKPPDAVVGASLRDGPADIVPLRTGARLFADSQTRIASPDEHFVYQSEPETSVPRELDGAVLIRTRNAEKGLDGGYPLTIETVRPAEIWVGWYPDETQNYRIARRWLAEAESKVDAPRMMVARLRVHALVEAREWERAYEEYLELVRTRPPGDESAIEAFRNFLLLTVVDRVQSGDRDGAKLWTTRLQAEFPEWRGTPEQILERVARELGWVTEPPR
jgi:hypothetical protein